MSDHSTKKILQQLLEAEEAGRNSAEALEARARLLLDEIESEKDQISRTSREQTEQRITELEGKAEDQIRREVDKIGQDTRRALETLRLQADQNREAAVSDVVAQLLGEDSSSR